MASTNALGETSPGKDNILAGAPPVDSGEETYSFSPTKRTTVLRYPNNEPTSTPSYSEASSSQARQALQIHIADTDRRIQEASKLGTTLLEQKKQLKDRLKEVQSQDDGEELGPELRQKLVDLEKEFDDVGKDSVRTSLPKGRKPSMDFTDTASAAANAGSRLPMPSSIRRSKNQSPTRVHDIEFATEISTSLLGQVRQLQGSLAEKEEMLKQVHHENAQLRSDREAYSGRMRSVDDNEQRYKDENWNLETQVQDLTALLKDVTSREERLRHALSTAETKRTTSEREFEELKQTHGKLSDDHSSLRRQHDLDLSSIRRDITDVETERDIMQSRIDELTTQNADLAKAIAYRDGSEGQSVQETVAQGDTSGAADQATPEHSPPPSPTKLGTPRHGALESETLKSSLTHAHRMIQNLKNNIHREKTEKVELKRMLQDARDDIESRRNDGGVAAANAGRKRKPMPGQDGFKKPARPDRLGGVKGSREELINDPSWEEYNDSPDRPRQSIEKPDGRDLKSDVSDAFETADEKNTTTDDTDAFQTGVESNAGDSEGELTETEGPKLRSVSSNLARKALERRESVQSTASDDGGIYDMATPPAAPRYKMRANRGGFRVSETPSARDSPSSFMSNRDSPSSFISNQSQPRSKQNLAAELDDVDDISTASNTPSRQMSVPQRTPDVGRQGTVVKSPTISRPVMVDSGMLTDTWEPKSSIVNTVMGTITGAFGGAAVGAATAGQSAPEQQGTLDGQARKDQLLSNEDTSTGSFLLRDSMIEPVSEDATPLADTSPLLGRTDIAKPVSLQMSTIASQETAPVADQPLKENDPNVSAGANHFQQLLHPPPMTDTQSSSHPQLTPTASRDHDPVDPSSHPRDLNAATSTPAFLNDLLIRSGSGSRAGTPDSKRSFTAPAVPLKATSRDGQYTGSVRTSSRAPSFSSSMLAYEVAPSEPQPPPESFHDAVSTPSVPPQEIAKSLEEAAPAPDVASSVDRTLPKEDDNENDTFHEPILQMSSLDEPRSLPIPAPVSPPVETPTVKQVPSISTPTAGGLVNSGTQTSVSGAQVDTMLKDRARKTLANSTINGAAISTGSPRQQGQGVGRAIALGGALDSPKGFRRPGSAGTNQAHTSSPSGPSMPPLPADHREVIAAAANRSSSMVNVPPPSLTPGSKHRPRTPSGNYGQSPSFKAGTAPRNRAPSIARTEMSRRSSISSFASELDERFNGDPNGSIRASYMNVGPDGYEMSNADPRMIQAITQTMIGEFLWKYMRKAGRGDISNKRHKRFFWIHPYTRTLYWSSHDPSVTGRSEHSAKSVSIEAVRVISDDNPIPPGLHTKSIVVVTPGRSIQFTAPTSQRHETWFNALSYLLLRNNSTNGEDLMGRSANFSYNPNNQFSGGGVAEDLTDHNISSAGVGAGSASIRSTSRFSRRSFSSFTNNASYNRNSSTRTFGQGPSSASNSSGLPSSPQGTNSLAMRQSLAAQKRSGSSLSNNDRGGVHMDTPERSAHGLSSRGQEESYASAGLTSTAEEAGENSSGGDGFKKPALPASASAGANSSSGKAPSISASTMKSRKSESGRMGSLTSRLRRSSFASLGRTRGRAPGDRSEAAAVDAREGLESPSVPVSRDSADTDNTAVTARTAASKAAGGRSSRQGHHHHHHDHHHGSASSGGLENVRACCDGKHDLSSLHHRSSSRNSMTHSQQSNHQASGSTAGRSSMSLGLAGASAAAAKAVTPSNPAQTSSSLRL